MGMSIVDLDLVFESLDAPPVILNDEDVLTAEGRKKFDRLLFTHYGEESLSPTPTCECGALKGRYLLNVLCTQCLTVVSEPIKNEIKSLVWMRPLPGIEYLINPVAWQMMVDKFTQSQVSFIRWLTNPNYRVQGKLPIKLQRMLEAGHIRSYNYFIRNYDEVLYDLVYGDGRIKPVPTHVELYNLLIKHKQKILVKHLPIPSKVAFIIEESSGRKWADKTMNLAINAIRRAQETEEAIETLKIGSIESRTVNILDSLGEFYYEFLSKNWDGKTQIFRKHIFGARLHFTARGVITSLTNVHNKSELHFPWALSVQLFKVPIASKLIHRGYSAENAQAMINGYTHVYHPVLDEIFQELIADAHPYMGLPVIFQRNPSLARGSAQLFWVTKVKTNPADNTIGVSILSISVSNADFDGDEMNVTYLDSKELVEKFKRLDPSYNVLDNNVPYQISGNLKLPAPVVATIANWTRYNQ